MLERTDRVCQLTYRRGLLCLLYLHECYCLQEAAEMYHHYREDRIADHQNCGLALLSEHGVTGRPSWRREPQYLHRSPIQYASLEESARAKAKIW